MITPSFSLTATERVLPRLALDFTTASLDSRITFTRALNTATRVNSSGLVETVNADLPRFDYDPITKVCKGLLIEESRQNAFLQSEDFSTSWSSINITVSTDATTAPDGNATADKWIPDNGATSCWTWQSPLTVATWTQTIFAKYAGITVLQMNFFSNEDGDRFAQFDLQAGTVGTVSAGVTASITPFDDGWYRCRITYTMTGLTNQAAQPIRMPSTETGDGTKGYYVWGAQCELGAFPTSYIPTTTTALTRNADVATMTGTNFSSWYNANGGSFVFEFEGIKEQPANFTRLFVLYKDASNSCGVAIFPTGLSSYPFMDTAGVSQLDFITLMIANQSKVGFVFGTNNFKYAINASIPGVDTVVDIPQLTDFYLGCDQSGASQINGYLKKVAYYLPVFTSPEIQAFTK